MKKEHETENFVFYGRFRCGEIYRTPNGYFCVPDEDVEYKFTVVEQPPENLGKEICEQFCKMVEN